MIREQKSAPTRLQVPEGQKYCSQRCQDAKVGEIRAAALTRVALKKKLNSALVLFLRLPWESPRQRLVGPNITSPMPCVPLFIVLLFPRVALLCGSSRTTCAFHASLFLPCSASFFCCSRPSSTHGSQ